MKNPNFIQIDIPDLCNQKWEEMTPCAQGRFCAHCQKTVIDFTTWNDSALYAFFAKQEGDVCGRFLATQTGRRIPIPPQPHSWLYRIAVALGLTVMSLHGADAYAQCKPPLVQQTATYRKVGKDSASYCYQLSGVVMDEKKQPIIGAVVQVSQGGIMKGGAATGIDGDYVIKPLDEGVYEVQIVYIGYEKYIVKDVRIAAGVLAEVGNICMKPASNTPPPVKMGGWKKPLISREHREPAKVEEMKPVAVPDLPKKEHTEMDAPGKHTFKKEDMRNMPIR